VREWNWKEETMMLVTLKEMTKRKMWAVSGFRILVVAAVLAIVVVVVVVVVVGTRTAVLGWNWHDFYGLGHCFEDLVNDASYRHPHVVQVD
tara:strand:- start:484 stop:756 length:273 start_codon:yes stop_codon:yes gene_type:complete